MQDTLYYIKGFKFTAITNLHPKAPLHSNKLLQILKSTTQRRAIKE